MRRVVVETWSACPRWLLVMTLAFLASSSFTTYAIVDRSHSYCRAQNSSIEATKEVLRVSYLGPHRFNTPQDIRNRHEIYYAQVARLDGARCQ